MPMMQICKTAREYANAIGPHLEHEWYRCDKPQDRLMGKGCRTCGTEAYIAIADFREHGDLEEYEKELKPFEKDPKKK